jgi:halocyanin-like protein
MTPFKQTGTNSGSRRQLIKGTFCALYPVVVAGCTGSSDDKPTTETASPTPTMTPTEKPTNTPVDRESAINSWLSDTSNYSSIEDFTGEDPLTIDVGTEGNRGNYAFAPPAVEVSTGTTIVWNWTGEGGPHNVVDNDGAFDSGEPTPDENHTFEVNLDQSGLFLYVCEPHESIGMKGAISTV